MSCLTSALSIQEAIEAYNSMKDLPHLKDYARLAFAYGLLLQSTTVQEMMEAKTIIDNAQDAIHACPFFEFHRMSLFLCIFNRCFSESDVYRNYDYFKS